MHEEDDIREYPCISDTNRDLFATKTRVYRPELRNALSPTHASKGSQNYAEN